ncbi:MAG: TM2 domain-containing protein [Bosea sp. (in: a-proteobacteria)]|nr:TM2 domain-containing protein [Bosea sp. (in: a-proteobacteria)]
MNQQNVIFQIPLKSIGIAYLVWLLLGFWGGHKFYLGRPMIGLLYLLTFGFLGVGVIIDLFTIPSQVRVANDKLMRDSGAFFSASTSQRFSSSGSHSDHYDSSFVASSAPTPHERQIDMMVERYKEKQSSAPPTRSAEMRPRPTFGKRNA